MRVLFVCLGNICRSPLAEGLFVSKVKTIGMESTFQADSCGTSNYNLGDLPDHRTVANALTNGVTLDHTARQLRRSDFDLFDRIIVMDKQNLKYALSFSGPEHHSKIILMRAFDPMGNGDVPDPYYGGEADFQQVFEILDRSTDELLRHLIEEIRIKP